jgi:hypothetical protein
LLNLFGDSRYLPNATMNESEIVSFLAPVSSSGGYAKWNGPWPYDAWVSPTVEY